MSRPSCQTASQGRLTAALAKLSSSGPDRRAIAASDSFAPVLETSISRHLWAALPSGRLSWAG